MSFGRGEVTESIPVVALGRFFFSVKNLVYLLRRLFPSIKIAACSLCFTVSGTSYYGLYFSFLFSCSSDTTGTYASSFKAFIFSLHNNEDLGPFKSMVKRPGKYAIFKDKYFGPTFGRGYDIQVENYANRHRYSYTEFGNSYAVPGGVIDRRTILAGTYKFSPNEVEVFYLA